jgi:hypothetical protein
MAKSAQSRETHGSAAAAWPALRLCAQGLSRRPCRMRPRHATNAHGGSARARDTHGDRHALARERRDSTLPGADCRRSRPTCRPRTAGMPVPGRHGFARACTGRARSAEPPRTPRRALHATGAPPLAGPRSGRTCAVRCMVANTCPVGFGACETRNLFKLGIPPAFSKGVPRAFLSPPSAVPGTKQRLDSRSELLDQRSGAERRGRVPL